MPTNLAIDDRLIEEARRVGHHSTKKEAVTAALDEYIRRRKQMQIPDLLDTTVMSPNGSTPIVSQPGGLLQECVGENVRNFPLSHGP